MNLLDEEEKKLRGIQITLALKQKLFNDTKE